MFMVLTGLILFESSSWFLYLFFFKWVNFVLLSLYFLVDLSLNIFAFGFLKTLRNWEYALEILLQVAVWILVLFYTIKCATKDNCDRAVRENCAGFMILVLIIRKVRLLNYMLELREFRVLVTTFKNFSSPFASMMLTLYCVMFIYAVIGIYFFTGMVDRASML